MLGPLAAIGGVQGLGSILTGIGGLFKKKPKVVSPAAQATADAAKYGFNRLTLLNSGAYSGFVEDRIPKLVSAGQLLEALGSAVDTGFNREQMASYAQVDPARLTRVAYANRQSLNKMPQRMSLTGGAADVTGMRSYTSTKLSASGSVRPRPRPGPRDKLVPVYMPDGSLVTIPKSQADYVGAKAWDPLAMEQRTSLVGDFWGDVGSAVDGVVSTTTFGEGSSANLAGMATRKTALSAGGFRANFLKKKQWKSFGAYNAQ